jgi:hypothetical protein
LRRGKGRSQAQHGGSSNKFHFLLYNLVSTDVNYEKGSPEYYFFDGQWSVL